MSFNPHLVNTCETLKIEVGIELGTMIKIQAVDNLLPDELRNLVTQKIIEKFHIDNNDTILNSIIIYNRGVE